MAWQLSSIRTKTRRLSGRISTNQLSDAEVLDYINEYYTETLVAELNLNELETWKDFQTTVNDEDYTLDSTDFVVRQPIYVNGDEINFYTDPDLFYNAYPRTYYEESIGTGDGATVTFTATTSQTPVRLDSMVVDDASQVLTTNTSGILSGDGSGTITQAGALSVTFSSAPDSGDDIRATYEYWDTGKPGALLWHDGKMILRQVPDKVYSIRALVETKPTAFANDTDTPLYNDWGKLIAYGAAKDILQDFEGEAIAMRLLPEYTKQLNKVRRRFIRQFEGQRAVPTF